MAMKTEERERHIVTIDPRRIRRVAEMVALGVGVFVLALPWFVGFIIIMRALF